MNNLIEKIKSKREFSGLPDSIIKKCLNGFNSVKMSDDELVKEVRKKLRKYYGVFLTNKVIKPKDIMDYNAVLLSHISSKKRNYEELYGILSKYIKKGSIVFDFGCGVNGFSFDLMKKYFGCKKYLGFEASNQIVNNMNLFFENKKVDAKCIWCDIMELDFLKKIINSYNENKLFFCFQVTDALDKLKEGSGLTFLLFLKECMNKEDKIVLSFPTESISGRETFNDNRKNFFISLEKEFNIEFNIKKFGENFLVLKKTL